LFEVDALRYACMVWGGCRWILDLSPDQHMLIGQHLCMTSDSQDSHGGRPTYSNCRTTDLVVDRHPWLLGDNQLCLPTSTVGGTSFMSGGCMAPPYTRHPSGVISRHADQFPHNTRPCAAVGAHRCCVPNLASFRLLCAHRHLGLVVARDRVYTGCSHCRNVVLRPTACLHVPLWTDCDHVCLGLRLDKSCLGWHLRVC